MRLFTLFAACTLGVIATSFSACGKKAEPATPATPAAITGSWILSPERTKAAFAEASKGHSEFPTEAKRQEAIQAIGALIDGRDVSTVGITFKADGTCTIINPPMRDAAGTWKVNATGGVEITASGPFAQPMELRSGELHMMQGGLPMMVWVKGTPKPAPAMPEPPKAP